MSEAENLIQVLSSEEVAAIEAEIAHLPDRESAAIEALQIVQANRGWISDASLSAIARLSLAPVDVTSDTRDRTSWTKGCRVADINIPPGTCRWLVGYHADWNYGSENSINEPKLKLEGGRSSRRRGAIEASYHIA